MKGLTLQAIGQDLIWQEIPDPVPGDYDAIVDIKAAALNRRDFWISQGMYPGIRLPVVLGSDGVGRVTQIGEGVEIPNHPVLINPGLHWGFNQHAQAAEFEILGMPTNGTLAQRVCVPFHCLHPVPGHLTLEQAAGLPLAGVTAYRGLFTRGQLQSSDRVLVTGIGGGVATLAVQFAVASGATVAVTSSSAEKIDRAKRLGAVAGFNYQDPDWHRQVLSSVGEIDLIFDGAGGAGYSQFLELAAPAARIVNYGSTAGLPAKLDLFKVFWKQLNLLGTTMGSEADFAAMLQFVEQHQIVPVIDSVMPMEMGQQALQRMADKQQFGKIVLVPPEATP